MQDIDPETNKSRGYFLMSGTVRTTPDASLNKKKQLPVSLLDSQTDVTPAMMGPQFHKGPSLVPEM